MGQPSSKNIEKATSKNIGDKIIITNEANNRLNIGRK